MPTFEPILAVLPPPQRELWSELSSTPRQFVLYGGTALAIRLGHRTSIDFEFFSNRPFDPDRLAQAVPYLMGTERVQVAANTLTCRVERGGPVLISFFGGLDLGQVGPCDIALGVNVRIASLLDIAGTKVAVVQKRAELRDYLDIDALLKNGVDLAMALAAGRVVHGHGFNALITLKALSYFDDVPALPVEVRKRLLAAVDAVDPTRLPVLEPYCSRASDDGCGP